MPHSDAAWRGGARPEEAEGADRHPLFPGGGEMAARCRALEWAATPLGHVEAWPASLRTAAVLVVAAGFPQVLLWGPELVQLYNDGYRALMGAKHPNGLGQPTRACWPEVWHLNAPVYARVWAGETVMLEDALFPITRSGVLEDAWFTLGYSPVWDVTGDATHASDATVVGVLVTLIETTAQVRGRAAQGERERLHAALEVERSRLAEVFRQAPAFLAVLRGPAHVFDLANDAYYQLVGHREVVGKPVLEALPEIEGQGFVELLDGVLQTGQPFLGREVPILLARTPGAPPEERFVDLTYLPLVEAGGTRAGVIAHGSDVTAQVEARREVERLLGESERAHADAAAAHTEADAERRQLALVLDRLPVGVVVVDANAAVVHLNPACDAVLGTSLRPVARLEDYATYGGGLHADGRPYAPEDYPIARACSPARWCARSSPATAAVTGAS
jgi:PAS domain-containing protein